MMTHNIEERVSFAQILGILEKLSIKRVSINEEHYLKQITFEEKIKHLSLEEQANYFENLGKLYLQNLGRFDKAKEFYEKTYEVKKKLY